MSDKVAIVPIGLYKERVLKAIARSGANRVYMLLDDKPEFEVEKEVFSELEERLKGLGLRDMEIIKKTANLTQDRDIYRVYVGLIKKERREDPNVKFVLDVTACPKEVTLIVQSLANAYGATVAHVPGKEKITKKIIDERYKIEKEDPGGDYTEVHYGFTDVTQDEIMVLQKCYDKRVSGLVYGSVNDMISEIAKDQRVKQPSDAYRKKYLRIVRNLAERQLLTSVASGRTKSVDLTDIGLGVIEGIRDASPQLGKGGKDPLVKELLTK